MPRGDHYLDGSFVRGKIFTSLSTEEAAGIGLLVVVLAALLLIGCWYYKKRRGYRNLLSKNFRMATIKTSEGKSALLGSKLSLQEYNSNFTREESLDSPVQLYGQLPPEADYRVKLEDIEISRDMFFWVPDAPPAYDKISTSPLPPPYAP